MKELYYTPEIEEFHVGFEFEINHKIRDGSGKREWCQETFNMKNEEVRLIEYILKEEPSNIRVKYLDEEDIKTWFNDKEDSRLDNHIKPSYTFYKLLDDGTIYSVEVYWHMVIDERENLIIISQGYLNNFPYRPRFVGEVKNKTEFKKVLKQLNIL